jgi:hypothetical protein
MQSHRDHVEKGFTTNRLTQLGGILKLPPRWTFTKRVLDRDLVIAPRAPRYTAPTVVGNSGNAGCSFDAACTYIP